MRPIILFLLMLFSLGRLLTIVVFFSLCCQALHSGISVDEIYELTAIDKWFLYRLKRIVELEQRLSKQNR